MRRAARVLTHKQGLPVWVLVGAALLVLAFWNWQLVVATLSGVVIMLLVYAAQEWDWQRLLLRSQQFFYSPNRQLAIAVIAGAVGVLLTYMTLAIWGNTENHWLASVDILQLLATLAILILLGQQIVSRWLQKQQVDLDRLVMQLNAPNDLDRLIAVRQLAQCVHEQRFPLNQEKAIIAYCQVILSRETVPAVRDAALETLKALKYLPEMK